MLDRKLVLPHLLARRAASDPRGTCIQDVRGPALSFGEVWNGLLRWAGALRRQGVGAGDTVLTFLPHRLEAYLAWLGISWLRAIEVPVNTAYRGALLRYLIANSRARVLVVSELFLDRLAEIAPELDGERERVVVVPDASGPLPPLPFPAFDGGAFLDGAPGADDLPGPEYRDVAAMIYTSGTTGPSKGVLVTWASLYELVGVLPPDVVPEGQSYYSVYSGFHIAGKAAFYTSQALRRRLVFRDAFSASSYWDDTRRFNCAFGGLVASMASLLLQQPERPDDADNPMRGVIMAPLIPRLEEFKQRFGVRVCTAYGMTEIAYPFASGWQLANGTSVGRLRQGPPGYQVKVVDENDEDVGPGRVGELIVRTDAPWIITPGYFGMPERNAEAWRNGWFHTGDGFSYDADGNFYFADRIKDAIRRRGENISSFEVESGVNAHPAVLESAAIGVPSEHGEDEVKVLLVLKPGAALEPRALIEFLIPRMPRFMIPRYVEIVSELPKTEATQRTQKYRLRERAPSERTWDREAAGVRLPADRARTQG
jgi:crotonobetaine/carnitine-CoA ligase